MKSPVVDCIVAGTIDSCSSHSIVTEREQDTSDQGQRVIGVIDAKAGGGFILRIPRSG
jgi:hypothetical protein